MLYYEGSVLCIHTRTDFFIDDFSNFLKALFYSYTVAAICELSRLYDPYFTVMLIKRLAESVKLWIIDIFYVVCFRQILPYILLSESIIYF